MSPIPVTPSNAMQSKASPWIYKASLNPAPQDPSLPTGPPTLPAWAPMLGRQASAYTRKTMQAL
jgi:hypothetical protein